MTAEGTLLADNLPSPPPVAAPHHPELLGEVDRVQHGQRRPLPDADVAHPPRFVPELLRGEE